MHMFLWREAHHVETATCPNWVLSCVGRAVAVPYQESPGCRCCHDTGMMPPGASGSALRSKRTGGQRSESASMGGCPSEGNRKQSHEEGLSGEVSCVGHHHLYKDGTLRGW